MKNSIHGGDYTLEIGSYTKRVNSRDLQRQFLTETEKTVPTEKFSGLDGEGGHAWTVAFAEIGGYLDPPLGGQTLWKGLKKVQR